MHCHRIFASALFADMSSLLTSFISKIFFLFQCFLQFLYTVKYIYFYVALIIVLAVVDAAVASLELQRERERDSLSAV